MNEQTRATATTAPAAAQSPEPQDAWDRLAALAFGDTASASGCSEHTHDCTCAPEQPPAEAAWSQEELGELGGLDELDELADTGD